MEKGIFFVFERMTRTSEMTVLGKKNVIADIGNIYPVYQIIKPTRMFRDFTFR